MKIIGERKDENEKIFLLECRADELANFIGFYAEYHAKESVSLLPGAHLRVAECYKDAKLALDLNKEAKGAATQLKAAATKFLSFFEKNDGKEESDRLSHARSRGVSR